MQKILISGGLGFIGSNTILKLCQVPNVHIVIIDNLCNSDISVLDKLRAITGAKLDFYPVDMSDRVKMNQLFQLHQFDAVIHFAALKSVPESVANPLVYFRNNLDSTIVLLECMVQYKTQNLVFSSSCSVYGNPANSEPITEQTVFGKPECPYAATKQMCEQIIQSVCGLQFIILRYFNPGASHEDLPKCEKSLISLVCSPDPLVVFGNNYPTHDGTPARDYIHIEDIADGHICALQKLMESKTETREVYNLGSGSSHTVLDVIRVYEKVSGAKREYTIANRREGDIGSICADCTLSNTKLGWVPKKTMEDIVLATWKHTVKNKLVQ